MTIDVYLCRDKYQVEKYINNPETNKPELNDKYDGRTLYIPDDELKAMTPVSVYCLHLKACLQTGILTFCAAFHGYNLLVLLW